MNMAEVQERLILDKRIKKGTKMMKYILVFVFLCVFGVEGYAQNESKYIGVYKRQIDNWLAELFILPDHNFVMASSSVNRGTWRECDGNLILYPVEKENKKKTVSIYGRYDDKFAADSIYITFNDLEDSPILYSFNNVNNTSTMHSVYNLFPACFNISGSFANYMNKGALKRGELNSIQLMLVPDIYKNVEFNDTKNPKFKGSISGCQHSFLLPPEYNDYQVAFNESDDELSSLPFMGTMYENGLYFEGHLFSEKESLLNYSQTYLDSLIMPGNDLIVDSKHFSEYRYDRGYNEWTDYNYQLIADISADINKVISFDLQYLIAENCNDIQNENEGYNGKYTSLVIAENTRKAMSYWKTFTSYVVAKDMDSLVAMIDFPLLRTTEEDSIGTPISKDDFLADFDKLFSPSVMDLFERCNMNGFLKDRKYNLDSMDDDGRIYALDFEEEKGSVSIYVREKDQMTNTEFIIGEKDGRLKLKEISIQIY